MCTHESCIVNKMYVVEECTTGDEVEEFDRKCWCETAEVNKAERLNHAPLFPVHDPSSIRISHFALEISPTRINFAQT